MRKSNSLYYAVALHYQIFRNLTIYQYIRLTGSITIFYIEMTSKIDLWSFFRSDKICKSTFPVTTVLKIYFFTQM